MKPLIVMISLLFIIFNAGNCYALQKEFSFKEVNLISCYDGDTCRFELKDNNFPSYLNPMSIRLYGIDTAEIKKSKTGNNDKILAQKAKNRTNELLKNASIITLDSCIKEKYFRFVCKVYADGKDVSTILLNEKLATPYFGGTKDSNPDN